MKKESVGVVETKYYNLSEELKLESGDRLKDVTIAYETYGTLNKQKSNAILVCHALSGDAHVAGWHEGDRKPGWWDNIIGPGKCLDTDRYFIICSNVIGGCQGSTGPSSTNPETGKPYALKFPIITIKDMVKAQKKLIDHLEIKQLFSVVGGSMGGMQVLQWCVSYPDMVRSAIPIATTSYSSPQQIAFNEVGRRAIISDPHWNEGNYYTGEFPDNGLALARMIGHITYLSNESMYEKFGRRLQDKEEYGFDFSTDFEVESYLHYQGNTFTKRFDANSYLYISKAIDYFDLTENGTLSLSEAFKDVKARVLVISVDSDWLYTPAESKEIVMALTANEVEVSYCQIKSSYGHDAFLLEIGQLSYIINGFYSETLVVDVMTLNAATVTEDSSIEEAAELMLDEKVTHLPVVSEEGKMLGIVTAWDISKAVALKYDKLDEIMTRDVITALPQDPIESAAIKMRKHNISSLPVVNDQGRVLGLITTDHISTLIAGDKY
ncbi:homoserine O-acetyltransferase MetX [Methanobacterium formicicum]|uniref:Homoserine O-acetyltransferase n=1 Tax=Methanobacterium formicicum TaxID=2162 RepID=A0A089ZDP8_METFO|nr:homoserine O-acetyltransferase [Methanobacterium formicicum]AIS32172.1 homoserine O-acetyltransferase MetX1 [Methanobacterium formicicum]CEL24593.1 Homoserine O-acetyltransferase [Methanobacterium formicicum]